MNPDIWNQHTIPPALKFHSPWQFKPRGGHGQQGGDGPEDTGAEASRVEMALSTQPLRRARLGPPEVGSCCSGLHLHTHRGLPAAPPCGFPPHAVLPVWVPPPSTREPWCAGCCPVLRLDLERVTVIKDDSALTLLSHLSLQRSHGCSHLDKRTPQNYPESLTRLIKVRRFNMES